MVQSSMRRKISCRFDTSVQRARDSRIKAPEQIARDELPLDCEPEFVGYEKEPLHSQV